MNAATLELQARQESRPYRPAWAVGVTNEQLIAVARQESVNPYHPDWADGLDSKVIREARQGAYRNPNTPTIRQLEQRASDLSASPRAETTASEALPGGMTSTTISPNAAYVNSVLELEGCDCAAYVDVKTYRDWLKAGFQVQRKQTGIKLPQGGATVFHRCQVKEVKA